jgi:hypothetical protein
MAPASNLVVSPLEQTVHRFRRHGFGNAHDVLCSSARTPWHKYRTGVCRGDLPEDIGISGGRKKNPACEPTQSSLKRGKRKPHRFYETDKKSSGLSVVMPSAVCEHTPPTLAPHCAFGQLCVFYVVIHSDSYFLYLRELLVFAGYVYFCLRAGTASNTPPQCRAALSDTV